MFLRIFDWKCAGQSSFLVRLGIVHTEFATCVCGLMLIKTGGGPLWWLLGDGCERDENFSSFHIFMQ
jgi:hypothetical protein